MHNPTIAERAKKSRSRIACKRCHDRRVRCDVVLRGPPCSGCRSSCNGDTCRLLESKRSRGEDGRFSAKTSSRASATYAGMAETSRRNLDDGTESVIEVVPRAFPGAGSSPRTTNTLLPESCSFNEPPARATSEEADQWSKILSQDRVPVPDGRRVTYLGESWTLSYMIQWKSRGSISEGNDSSIDNGRGNTGYGTNGNNDNNGHNGNTRSSTGGPSPSEFGDDAVDRSLHIPMPMEQDTPSPRSAMTASWLTQDQLPADIQLALVEAYFRHNHTLYPVVCQDEFRASFANRMVSPLLLSAVLYTGALHVSDPVIYQARFDSRESCLRKLYSRAKKIFFDEEDNDEIGDQLSRVQAAFLLHNMWLSPNATMDPWTWLGLAIRLAQNMGMHRSTARSSLKAEDRQLWKRIWWSLYSRDMQSASALGKPPMINEADCDVEDLEPADFERRDRVEMRLFVIEQVKLSRICGDIMSTRFRPVARDKDLEIRQKAEVMGSLMAWKANVPPELRCPKTCSPKQIPIEALLLQVLLNNMLLLLHRPRIMPCTGGGDGIENNTASWKIAFNAASAITQVTETIMNYKSLHQCPLFYTSALFGCMTMHVIRGPAGEHQLGLCMIAMRTLSTMYWAAGWIRNIFQKLGEKKQKSAYGTSSVPTRVASPVPAANVADRPHTATTATTSPAARPTLSTSSSSISHAHGVDPVLCPSPLGPPPNEPLSATLPNYLRSPGPNGIDVLSLLEESPTASAAEGVAAASSAADSWTEDLVGAENAVFGPLGNNPGLFADYPVMNGQGFAGIDPDLADCWQDLLGQHFPFNNPFIGSL